MGVRGLFTYMKNPTILKPYELQNTHLVIDGDNLSHVLYGSCADDGNWIYGGAYDTYAEKVSSFFNNLLECNVTPFVVMDGSYDDSKLDTVLKRLQDRFKTVREIITRKHYDQRFTIISPPLRLKVFIQVLRKMKIPHVRCSIESDTIVAAIAKALDCPVLSIDSDFYLFGSTIIASNTLHDKVHRGNAGNALMCRIFRLEDFLNGIPGLTHRKMSLIALLLGNDFVKSEMFVNFLTQFNAPYPAKRWEYDISRIFHWLSEHTLEEAIEEILSEIVPSKRQEILHAIEETINHYTRLPAVDEYLKLLNATKYCVESAVESLEYYKFQGCIESLPYRGVVVTNSVDGNIPAIRDELISHQKESLSNISSDELPVWFLHDYHEAKLPGNFLSLIKKHYALAPVQIDDVRLPSSNCINFKILQVTFGILSSATDTKPTILKYVNRDQCGGLMVYEIKGTKTVPLTELRTLSLNHRRKILDDSLGILEKRYIDALPPEWKLYVACFKYWKNQLPRQALGKCFTYSIVFSLLYNIIITKIGQYKSLRNLRNIYPSLLSDVSRETNAYLGYCFEKSTIVEAYKDINTSDCFLALPFFMIHAESRPIAGLNTVILHSFAEFQNCLLVAIDLNALLGYPYEEFDIASLFNGPLLYNVCDEFSRHSDVNDYVDGLLTNSPTLSRMFNILSLSGLFS